MKYSKPLSEMRDRMIAALPDNDLHYESRAIAGHVGRLATQAQSLEKLAEHRNPMETEAGHAKRVADAAQKFAAQVERIQKSIHALTTDASRRLDDQINATANLRPNDFAGEIRTAVRGMSAEKRRDTLAAAVESGDAATVAALVDAPSVVTGLNPQYTERMKTAFVEKHAANEWKAQGRLHETISSAAKAVGTAKAAAREATDPKYIAEIQQAADAATKAQGEFDAALSD